MILSYEFFLQNEAASMVKCADEMSVGIRSQHCYTVVTGFTFESPGVCIGMPYFCLHRNPDGIVKSRVVTRLH